MNYTQAYFIGKTKWHINSVLIMTLEYMIIFHQTDKAKFITQHIMLQTFTSLDEQKSKYKTEHSTAGSSKKIKSLMFNKIFIHLKIEITVNKSIR